MDQLYRFRKGWENENLAQYLLSRVAFIARPVSVSDDLGTDFYCTLFQKTKDGALLPRTAFAIQIKSHNDVASKKNRIDITGKVSYLKNLEIPFFFGVADNAEHSLTIYSGELIPRFFSFRGSPTKLTAVLCDRRRYSEKRTKNDKYDLDFPKVAKLTVDMSEENLSAFVSSFHGLCLLMYRNLSARASNEYLFETPHPDGTLELQVYAGGDSIKTFRGNVIKRLAEVFYNLKQQFLQAPKTFRKDEFLAYEQFYLNLKNINYYSHPYVEFVEQLYRDLRSEVDKSAQEKTT
jgi:Domain of unknown function (DUF4365)